MKCDLKWKRFHGQVWHYYGTWVSYYAVLIFSPESLQWRPVILCPRHLSPLICSVPLATDDWSDFKQAATAAMIGTELTTPSLNLIAVWDFSLFFFLSFCFNWGNSRPKQQIFNKKNGVCQQLFTHTLIWHPHRQSTCHSFVRLSQTKLPECHYLNN